MEFEGVGPHRVCTGPEMTDYLAKYNSKEPLKTYQKSSTEVTFLTMLERD